MKIVRSVRLILALTPLSLCVAAVPPVVAAPAAVPSVSGMPPGAPPLTAAQKQKQAARIKKFQQDAQALGQNSRLSAAQKQQQFQAMQAQLDQDMLAILTPTQRKAVTGQRTKVMDLRKQFAKQHQAEITRAQQLSAAYRKSFTPAQIQKMTTLQQQAQQQAQKIQSDPKASPQVKQQEIGAVARDTQRQVLDLLTPTQKSQAKELQGIQIKLAQELQAFAKAHGQQ